MPKKYKFSFCTVASRGYIHHAAGLWDNIQTQHAGVPLVILALDIVTYNFFSNREDIGLFCVSASDAWGDAYWENIAMRSNIPERAYASKAAIICWILETEFSAGTLLLDSDTLLLSPLDDLIKACNAYQLLLVPTRHDLISWRRSQNAGIFSAGVVGFSKNGIQYAQAWRAMCFEQCMVLPLDCVYNEQKYLEYLMGHADAYIVRDSGINVSATILGKVKPKETSGGEWYAADGTLIRMFHISRTTDKNVEFSRMKRKVNEIGLIRLGVRKGDGFFATEATLGFSKENLPRVSFGKLFQDVQRALITTFRMAMFLQRVFQSKEGNIFMRLTAFFKYRKKLIETIWENNKG